MNKKIIVIFVLTIIALIILTLYSFGPLSKNRTTNRVNPVSSKPVKSEKTTIGGKQVTLNSYHNKDLKENYYGVSLPSDWNVQTQKVGSYSASFNNGNGMVELMDVPDNSTLELFVLSQEEPKLKMANSNYQRADYQKLEVNNNGAYQLMYTSKINGADYTTVKTYISGPDHSAVLTFSAPTNSLNNFQPIFTSILNSFQWENK